LYDQNKFKQVVEAYKSGTNSFTKEGRPEATMLAASAYQQLGQGEAAQELYTTLIKEFPDSSYAQEAQCEQLRVIYNSNRPGDLISKADDLLQQNLSKGLREKVTLYKAEALYKTKQYQAAIPIYQSLQGADFTADRQAEVSYHFSWANFETGDYVSAAKAFGDFVAKFPSNKNVPTALTQKGISLLRTKDANGALQAFNQLLTRYPAAKERELALEKKALILGEQQDNQGMSDAFRQLLKEFPKSPAAAEANYWIGKNAYEAHNYKEAIAPLENARKLNRTEYFERASLRLINCHYNLEDQDKLAAELDLYSKSGTGKAPTEKVRWLADRLMAGKSYEKASRFYAMLVNREEDRTSDDLLNFGKCLYFQKKYGDAIKSYRKYLELPMQPPDKATGLIALGQAQLGLNQYEDAQKSANDACLLQMDGRINAEGRMLSGDIALAKNDYEEASKIYLSISVVFDDPNLTPQALEKAYSALLNLGNEVEAKKVLNKLQSQYPEYQMSSSHAAN